MKAKLFNLTLFVLLGFLPGILLGQESHNVAKNASTIEAHYTAAWNNLYAINNEISGVGMDLPNNETWGSWSANRTETGWLTYEWSNEYSIDSTIIYFWTDTDLQNAGNGVAMPQSYSVQYWNATSSEWNDVTLLSGETYPLNRLEANVVRFETISTTKLRLLMNASTDGATYAALGVTEWEVYSTIADPIISTNAYVILSNAHREVATVNVKGINLSEDITIHTSENLAGIQLSATSISKDIAESLAGFNLKIELIGTLENTVSGTLEFRSGTKSQFMDVILSDDLGCFEVAEGNIVPNPYFVTLNGFAFWETAPQIVSIVDGVDVKCGATCVQFTGSATGLEVQNRYFAKGNYVISGWINTNGTFETGIYANGGNLASDDTEHIGEVKGGNAINFIIPNTEGQWQFFEYHFNVANSVYGGCWINNGREKTGTNVLLDNWQVYDVAIPNSSVTTNGDYKIKPIAFNHVHLHDQFWSPRIKQNQEVTIPIAIEQCYSTGRVDNFKKAAGLIPGYFNTEYTFDDTDIYKILEGMSYSTQMFPNKALEAQMDTLIHYIELAQEEDGYLYTARTAGEPGNFHSWVGANRWEKAPDLSHELYNCGHLFEAATAHYQATGKSNLLDIAIKAADLLVDVYLKGGSTYEPGHQIVEMGLVKMSRVTGNQDYLKLAKYFLDLRGNNGVMRKEYSQSHKPVVYQDEAVGHAVRAVYMYSGMADVAALTGNDSYLHAIDTIWHNVVDKKYYINGGIGARHDGEAFGVNYELPNHTAYCETCASIGNVYWNHRMFLMHGDSKYYDVLERTLYNGVISGISLSGDHFFYPNPLASDGNYLFNHGSNTRQEWFGCACCPSNLCRFIPSMPGYIYAQKNHSIYVNLFVEGETKLDVNGDSVLVSQTTNYPWEGNVQINIEPEVAKQLNVLVRIPGWANGTPVPGELYSYISPTTENVILKVNDEVITNYTIDKGYAVLSRVWNANDKITLELPMEVQRVLADAQIADDRGKVALERGPILYCLEWPDNESVSGSVIEDDATITTKVESEFLNGVVTLSIEGAIAQEEGNDVILKTAELKAIPYYSWDNRGIGEMQVWSPRSKELAKAIPSDATEIDTMVFEINQEPFEGEINSVYPTTNINVDLKALSAFFDVDSTQLSSMFGSSIEYAALNSNGDLHTSSTANAPGHWFDDQGNVVTWGNSSFIFSEFNATNFSFKVGQYPNVCNLNDEFTIRQVLTYTNSLGEKLRMVFVFNINITPKVGIKKHFDTAVRIGTEDNFLVLENLPVNAHIQILNLAGELIRDVYSNDSFYKLPLNAGINILNINNSIFKKIMIK